VEITKELIESRSIPEPNSGCWLWEKAVDRGGYGVIRPDYDLLRAHRLSYEIYKGKTDERLYVLHRCDVRCCVNPDHLFLGTHADNMKDMVRKGRGKYECKAIKIRSTLRKSAHYSNRTGERCVYKYGNRYRVYIAFEGKKKYLGSYASVDEAGAVVARFRQENGL
jgi:hypothetical protein